jgi:outer membrane lipoprotein-sorting protein
MKNNITIYVLFISLFFSAYTQAQTAEEIVAKHIEAVGGRANWAKVKSIRMESNLKAQGADVKITGTQIGRKAVRQDITVMGMTGYSIITTTEGWSYMPFNGQTKPEAMTADDVKNAQDELYIEDEFFTYKELGKTLEYYGKDPVDGVECHKIKITDKNEREVTLYLDPETYYILKKTSKTKANGKEQEETSTYGDYKKLPEGIVYAMSVVAGWGEIAIVKFEVNPAVDESIFKLSK